MTEVHVVPSASIPEWTFGDRLRKVRRYVGATQSEFAAKLGESVKTYSNWEVDRHPPGSIVAVAKRVELTTGVPAGWMLGLDEPVSPPPEPATAGSQSESGDNTISGSNSGENDGRVIEGPWPAPSTPTHRERSA